VGGGGDLVLAVGAVERLSSPGDRNLQVPPGIPRVQPEKWPVVVEVLAAKGQVGAHGVPIEVAQVLRDVGVP